MTQSLKWVFRLIFVVVGFELAIVLLVVLLLISVVKKLEMVLKEL
jgi:hypothetical protein